MNAAPILLRGLVGVPGQIRDRLAGRSRFSEGASDEEAADEPA